MQLNSDVSGSDLKSEINVTPLVDVVLVLLIIFMVVVPLLLQGYDANIARTSANPVPAQAEEMQLILSIVPTACRILEPPAGDGLPADCRVTLADREIPAADLPASVAMILGDLPPEKRVLFLAADNRLNYEGVLRIVDLAKSSIDDLTIEFITTD
ncbi:MAG TPA: biopolymer transporter ExbD [Candidatus Polarisedimenticolia bacterium]|jgi:biopolymer transport protein ExbD|nr:biopolymer transporter ExbD [Candidatus Polarisedimenticolia bacterium]